MGEPQKGALFPVEHKQGDKRFEGLGRDVARVIEQHCYGRPEFQDRERIEKLMFELIYGSRGAAGELEKRLNGTAAPLVAEDEAALDCYDCLAAAHELRRLKGAEGAVVVAVDERGHVHTAVAGPRESSEQLAKVTERVMRAVCEAAPEGVLEDVLLDFIVNDDGSVEMGPDSEEKAS